MNVFGKLSPTNGGSISVAVTGLRGKEVAVSLLNDDGIPCYEGSMRITRGGFVNSPKSEILRWVMDCGRTEADFHGPKNKRNTVFAEQDPAGTYFLQFADAPARDTSGEQGTESESPTVVQAEDSPVLAEPTSLETLRRDSWLDVPSQSGVYWWFFPETCLDTFRVSEFCNVEALNLRRCSSGKVCLYVGIAKNLRDRVEWHADQRLTQSSLRSGFLSTFRKTLLALNEIDYDTGFEEINGFMDRLDVSWQVTEERSTAKAIEDAEVCGEWDYPLNIQGNRSPKLQPFLQFLKRIRKEYSDRFKAE